MSIKNHNLRFYLLAYMIPAILVIAGVIYIEIGRAPFAAILNDPLSTGEEKVDALFYSIPTVIGRLGILVVALLIYLCAMGAVWLEIYPKEEEVLI